MELYGNNVTSGNRFAKLYRKFASGKENAMDNNRIGRRNSGTTEGDTAGVEGVIPDGNSLITFPTHNVRLDLSDDTVQHTVVDVVHFSTCYYHVVEVTRIYFVWTKTSQAASSVSLIKGA